MIKISDLSVGDWVYYDKGNTPYSIRSIYRTGIQDCVVLNDSVFPDGVIGFVDRLKPIPITAEILEKNGWEFCRDSLWWTTQIDAYTRANVWLGNNGECRVEVSCMTKELDYYFCFADVKLPNAHIHLLQRVLRLAGVEKEINL